MSKRKPNTLRYISKQTILAELDDYRLHLAQSTTKLKQMCDLCDSQRTKIKTADLEIARLKAILMAAKILIRSVEEKQ